MWSQEHMPQEKKYNPNENGAYTLETHLNELAKTDKAAMTLASIWWLDKGRICEQISRVSTPFLSYSDHGQTHSDKVLACIERILGERIRYLTAVDTWMLLECAYRHDTGMYVTHQEMQRDVSGDGFTKLLEELKSNVNKDVQKAAFYLLENKQSLLDDKKICPKDTLSWTLQTERSIMLVLAEKYRKEHPERSRRFTEMEWESSGHTEIPKRLWKIMALICEGHGEDRQWILEKLEQYEHGIGRDNLHPRFIQMLLRLGDLLDIDNNRFNPYQLAIWGEQPISSKVHQVKHQALSHLHISPESIELRANFTLETALLKHPECLDLFDEGCDEQRTDHLYEKARADWEKERRERAREYQDLQMTPMKIQKDLYKRPLISHRDKSKIDRLAMDQENRTLLQRKACVEVAGWNAWLEKDLKFFALHWSQITPKNFPGGVPRLTKNEIYWGNQPLDLETFDLRYTINHRRATDIIEGMGLYGDIDLMDEKTIDEKTDSKRKKDAARASPLMLAAEDDKTQGMKFVFIRELVQNATDATKLQLFRYLKEGRYVKAIEYGNDMKKWKAPEVLRSLGDFINRLAVHVHINYEPQDQSVTVTVEDVGTGIDRKTLKRMANIGSARNAALENEIKSMPDWLRPNGSFGVGMQSVFGVVREFCGESCARDGGNPRKLYFQSAKTGGGIFAVDNPRPDGGETMYGTKIIVRIAKEDLDRENITFYAKHDVFDQNVDELFQIIDAQVGRMLGRDLIPLEVHYYVGDVEVLYGSKKKKKYHFALRELIEALPKWEPPMKLDEDMPVPFAMLPKVLSKEKEYLYYDNEENMMLSLRPKEKEFKSTKDLMGQTRLFFRGLHVGAIVIEEDLRYPCWDVDAYLWSGRTDQTVTISRNRLLKEKVNGNIPMNEVIYQKILRVADKAVDHFFMSAKKDLPLRTKLFQSEEGKYVNALVGSLCMHRLTTKSKGGDPRVSDACKSLLEWAEEVPLPCTLEGTKIIIEGVVNPSRQKCSAFEIFRPGEKRWMVHWTDDAYTRATINFLEDDVKPEALYIDRFSDFLADRFTPMRMKRYSFFKTEMPVRGGNENEEDNEGDQSRLQSSLCSVYRIDTQPQDEVQMKYRALEAIYKALHALLGEPSIEMSGRMIIPGISQYSKLSVAKVPGNMHNPCLKPAGCYLIFPLANGELNEIMELYREALKRKNLKEEKKVDDLRTKHKERTKKEYLDIDSPNPNESFIRLVDYVMQTPVQTRYALSRNATKEEVVLEYKKMADDLLDKLFRFAEEQRKEKEPVL